MISNGETFPKPEAMSICAPYGIIPCTKQENISNKLALRRGSIWKRVAISFAIGPAIIRAIVLLAVHKLAKLTSPAILASAPRAESIRAVSFWMIHSIPPLYRIISNIPPAKSVTIINSPIPVIPFPIAAFQAQISNAPVSKPVIPDKRMPKSKTSITFIPAMAATKTTK